MEYSFTKENTWSMERSSTEVTSTSITAEIPFIGVGGGVEFSKQVTQSVILGKTISETKSYTSSVEVPIPPSYSCMVHLSASHKKVNVPYTATLTRYYSHYPTKSTSVIGTFKGANAFDIRVVIERCQPLNQSTPCMTAQ
ncbi:NATT4 protein, partial [Amia calva]|nr:NATT4 protein [Amia calva]